ncbi:MAG TPA: protein-L-isoaspartate(D-aspartate) O-methyltransferase [Hyphomonadaceae bacterium]|nr:protein-L-isoaspartate(D-aspartate) O-methyltransferase [Hyphomonadaceae bacterium]
MDEDDPRFKAARLVLALRQSGVTDQRVTEALEKTPRETFVPRPFIESAWENVELPIDCGQSLTRPVTVGVMIQALNVARDHTVLEIGGGSGYVAAVLSRLARRIYSIDRYRTLVDRARLALDSLGISSRVELRLSDGLLGWPEAGPFDRVLLMGSVPCLPDELARQVAPGGVAVLPVDRGGEQLIVRLERQADGSFRETPILKARFAPLQQGVAREL